jgi:hypothetical protein
MRTTRQFVQAAMLVAIGLCCGAPGGCQKQVGSSSRSVARGGQAGSRDPVPAIREIDDPHTGVRWELRRDPSHPGGPGLLTEIPGTEGGEGRPGLRTEIPGTEGGEGRPGLLTEIPGTEGGEGSRGKQGPARQTPAVRAGDRVLIDEDSPIAVIHLEAVALRPALIGSEILVRLAPSGSLFHAVVLGPGRATLARARPWSPGVRP